MTGASVGLGGGEVVLLRIPFERAVEILARGYRGRRLVSFSADQLGWEIEGDELTLNPSQVKVIQPIQM